MVILCSLGALPCCWSVILCACLCGCLWRPQQCFQAFYRFSIAIILLHGCVSYARLCSGDARYIRTAAADNSSKREREKAETAPLFLRLFVVPTAVESTQAHAHIRRNTVRTCHKTNTLNYGYRCCLTAATTSIAYGVIQVQSSRQYY